MITGYNTDVRRVGVAFHVQTEDKGEGNPLIESLVYVGGQVVAARRSSYSDLLAGGKGEAEIVRLIERQHRTMIAAIKGGRFDRKVMELLGERAPAALVAAVEGGAGAPTEVIGGGDGFAVGKDAPPEAVEFLEYLTNSQNQLTWAEAGSGIPVNPDAATGLGPELVPVAEGLGASTFLQLYLDQFFPSEVGTAINDQVALLFAGEASPEEAASAITAVAGG